MQLMHTTIKVKTVETLLTELKKLAFKILATNISSLLLVMNISIELGGKNADLIVADPSRPSPPLMLLSDYSSREEERKLSMQ